MSRSITRRRFLQRAATASTLALLPVGRLAAQVRFSSDPFKLGVACGDPASDGFVLWTRIAPEPLEPAQLGTVAFEVDWDVAEDASFARVVRTGRAPAMAHLAHSVHAEVGGLAPGREYYYRFRLGRYESPAGRALTAPAPGDSPPSLRYAICSCAHYEQGFFAAYRCMAGDRPDLIVGLGDYIYEGGYGERRVRLFARREAVSLDDYRARYAQYRTDPDLQAAHAACPWLATWDDHEVDDDYAGLTSEDGACGGEAERRAFAVRRAAAYQAWYEHMPVRPSRLRPGAGIRVYGTLDWGRLARFYLLDTRQYRSVQACARPADFASCDFGTAPKPLATAAGGGRMIGITDPACRPELEDAARTVLGEEQERWLEGALSGSRAQWNLLAQGTPVAPIFEGSVDAPLVYSDGWSGYPAAKRRLLDALARSRVANPVMLTGDLHAFCVSEVRDERGRTVAVELLTSSVANNNTDKSQYLSLNPHIRYHDGTHSGYILCDVTPQNARADIVAVGEIRDPCTPRIVLASFDVTSGDPQPRQRPP